MKPNINFGIMLRHAKRYIREGDDKGQVEL